MAKHVDFDDILPDYTDVKKCPCCGNPLDLCICDELEAYDESDNGYDRPVGENL